MGTHPRLDRWPPECGAARRRALRVQPGCGPDWAAGRATGEPTGAARARLRIRHHGRRIHQPPTPARRHVPAPAYDPLRARDRPQRRDRAPVRLTEARGPVHRPADPGTRRRPRHPGGPGGRRADSPVPDQVRHHHADRRSVRGNRKRTVSHLNDAEARAREELVPTPAGAARLDWFPARGQPRAVALLGHGTVTGVEAADLQALAAVLPRHGITVALVTQPYRIGGNPRVADEASLDSAWKAVWPGAAGLGLPVISGGRSAGSQVACRTAAELGALAVLALAYPLLGPGRLTGSCPRPAASSASPHRTGLRLSGGRRLGGGACARAGRAVVTTVTPDI